MKQVLYLISDKGFISSATVNVIQWYILFFYAQGILDKSSLTSTGSRYDIDILLCTYTIRFAISSNKYLFKMTKTYNL